MSETKHTPGKWWWTNESPPNDAREVGADYDGCAIICATPKFIIYSKDAKAGFPSKSRQKANAKRIVAAVNCHDDLLQAAKEALSQLRFYDENITIKNHDKELMEQLEAAIANAEGTNP